MKIAYFDCFSGISGDMCLGALVDAGASLEEISQGLEKLRVKGYSLSEKKVKRAGLAATKVDVVLEGKQDAKKWADIGRIIRGSSLPEEVKRKGKAVFRTLFEAEAKVHGEALNRVHLHELGAVDCMVDVFGTIIGLDLLGIEAVRSSAVNLGGGFVRSSHGILPVPAPATAEILKGVPVFSSDARFELTTPTGAAIVKTLSQGFGVVPAMTAGSVGSGAGSMDRRDRPNVLRLMIGESHERGDEAVHKTVSVIETNIDDMNPQVYEYLIERLFERGALDVFMAQVMMKKMRPGVHLTVLCEAENKHELVGVILDETTSIGLRFHEVSRVTLERRFKLVKTRYGKARVKISGGGGFSSKAMPEYEDCKRLAKEKGAALIDVMEAVRRAAKE